jgi:Cu/Zn superoxide dismutase
MSSNLSFSARHLGDLGNVVSDPRGRVLMDWYAPSNLMLDGEHSIVNRSIVVTIYLP